MNFLLVRFFCHRVNKNKKFFFRVIFITTILLIIYLIICLKVENHSIFKNQKLKNLTFENHFKKLNPVNENWGHEGNPVFLTKDQQKIADKLFSSAAFNVYISDRLSPNRSLPDPRPYECAKILYDLENLGSASVIIIFTNEIWSALIRSIWSVINRTPKKLLKEIILVDDYSDKFYLKDPFNEYIDYHFDGLVKLIRLSKREGLIRARLVGARHAKGDVIIFLDSHIEVTNGWIEPLMQGIKNNQTNVICPVIDIISDQTLEYIVGNRYFFQIGGFTWNGNFIWIDTDKEKLKKNPVDLVETPTMAGGLFAINREYFFKIGSYDENMEIWGGENLEISFRIWQCGGQLYIHPCSHVGHIFRDYHPYSFLGKDSHGLNTLRTVLVWMDEYARYFFLHRNDLRSKIESVNVSSRIELRKQLKCRSFNWFLNNIYPEKKYIYDQDVNAYGSVRNPITNLCLDNLNRPEDTKHTIGVYSCGESSLDEWTNQMFSFMKNGQIRREEGCLTVDRFSKDSLILTKCFVFKKHKALHKKLEYKKFGQIWKHEKGGLIKNEHFDLCLTTENLKSSSDLRAIKCNPFDFNQIWWFQQYKDNFVLFENNQEMFVS